MNTKPCECGRTGCVVRQREHDRPSDFLRRRYADRGCAMWHRNMTDPRMHESRGKGGLASLGVRKCKVSSDGGALITSVAWLLHDDARLRLRREAEGIHLSQLDAI